MSGGWGRPCSTKRHLGPPCPCPPLSHACPHVCPPLPCLLHPHVSTCSHVAVSPCHCVPISVCLHVHIPLSHCLYAHVPTLLPMPPFSCPVFLCFHVPIPLCPHHHLPMSPHAHVSVPMSLYPHPPMPMFSCSHPYAPMSQDLYVPMSLCPRHHVPMSLSPPRVFLSPHYLCCPHIPQFGRTEVIDNSLNPDFLHKFVLDYCFEERQNLRFDL